MNGNLLVLGAVDGGVVLTVVVVLFLIVLVSMGVRTVRPFEKGVIERLGKYRDTAAPGITFMVPGLDKMLKVDMREQVVDVPPQEVITKDNVVVTVDAVVYYEVTDPQKVIYNVADFYTAATKLAQTNLRNLVGDMALDESLTSRDQINTKLREILDDATDKWGTRIVRVEIQRIEPPADVTQAMHRQMKAERERRAMILEAEGRKQSEIEKATGERQAQALRAEGEANAIRTVADANKYREIAIAEGKAQATLAVFKAIHDANPTNQLLAIQYMETLKSVADGKATKIFLPLDSAGVMGSLGGIAELFREGGGRGHDGSGSGAAGSYLPPPPKPPFSGPDTPRGGQAPKSA
ncbi:MAG: hypothetical protein HMLKMBBP_03555 [Planctomycetes bacterium]|nr:hypothetical protein [Planctomycetota bacterium]